jgi:hypothetical protein
VLVGSDGRVQRMPKKAETKVKEELKYWQGLTEKAKGSQHPKSGYMFPLCPGFLWGTQKSGTCPGFLWGTQKSGYMFSSPVLCPGFLWGTQKKHLCFTSPVLCSFPIFVQHCSTNCVVLPLFKCNII